MLDELATMPDQVEALMRRVPRPRLDWKPDSWEGIPGERFSALEQACHLRDIEIDGYHQRFGRTIKEHHPDLASIDSYALAQERGYGVEDLDRALAAFRAGRAQNIAMLESVSAADWARHATFAEYGTVTLRGLGHILRSHDLQHLACLHWLLAKMPD
jgi:DinB superfamily